MQNAQAPMHSAPRDPLSAPVPLPAIAAVPQAVLAALLYGGWALLGWLAHALGRSVLEPRAGALLLAGVLITNLLLLALARQAGEHPAEAGDTLTTVHGIMGVIWATLYAHFTSGGADLALGMLLTAVALPALSLPPPMLLRLALFGWVAYTAVMALQLFGAETPGLATFTLHVVAATVLLGALLLVAGQLQAQREQMRARLDQLLYSLREARRHSERDELTRSYSRRHIMELLQREQGRAERSGEPFSICLLDIDHFKAVNDRFGHLTGDRILTVFARRIRRELRAMDSLNSGALPRALGRFGGEEFLVILPGTGLQGALRCAERLRQTIVSRPFNGLHQVTTSIGIAAYQRGETLEQLLRRCDEALYAAKRAGRNRVNCSTGPGRPDAIVMPQLRHRA